MITLKRTYEKDHATMGEIILPSQKIYTLELPWRDNQRLISCIPEGIYRITPYFSPKHQRMVFNVAPVLPRSSIEIHHGTTLKDTTGCIIVGFECGPEAVFRSKVCLDFLLEEFPDGEDLEIVKA